MNWQRLGGGLAISLIIGLLAGGYVFTQFKKMALAKTMPTIQVVVSARPLPLGTRLQASDLRLVTWPAAEPVQGMFIRPEDCVNRAVITSMVANEPILEGKLAPKEGGAGLAATIPDGMRAVSVSVNDVIGVAGFVVPGTMVDVLVTGGDELRKCHADDSRKHSCDGRRTKSGTGSRRQAPDGAGDYLAGKPGRRERVDHGQHSGANSVGPAQHAGLQEGGPAAGPTGASFWRTAHSAAPGGQEYASCGSEACRSASSAAGSFQCGSDPRRQEGRIQISDSLEHGRGWKRDEHRA